MIGVNRRTRGLLNEGEKTKIPSVIIATEGISASLDRIAPNRLEKRRVSSIKSKNP